MDIWKFQKKRWNIQTLVSRSPHTHTHTHSLIDTRSPAHSLHHPITTRAPRLRLLTLSLLFEATPSERTSVMFKLSPASRFLHQAIDHELSPSQKRQLNPIRLTPSAFTVFGGMESLQELTSDSKLIDNIQTILVEEELNKAQAPRNNPHPSGTIEEEKLDAQRPPNKTQQELDEIAHKAKNPFWLSEMQQFVTALGDDSKQFCRYITLNDPLHPNRCVHKQTHKGKRGKGGSFALVTNQYFLLI